MKKILQFCLIVSLFPTIASAAGDAAKGKAIFEQRCVTCHGDKGLGDGPAGINLPPTMKPRNLQSEPLKIAGDDAKFKELIVKGGAAFGLSPLMAPQSGLSDADLGDLLAYVRSLKK